ncbi:conserved Plasmodium protein, unknown function [Plasmodium gallinaceum]|uniref:Uncharacterized protein n=1 Tax=Plasmodium gallinaceum TaxID=5849 RepID=A0A1J1GUC3_PLAGA|nr:conserved Plasmodium protein, unknown function [Plasmodium gallinaceum]CRG96111.1 conserved Plasmodium protein, unknown function [Plasmodium gallinaceum]
MNNFSNFFILMLYFLLFILCSSTKSGKLINVTYINDNNLKSELDDFQYIYINDSDDYYKIKSSNIGEIKLKDEIYFYKSYTKVINYFKYGIPVNVHFIFEYNDGDLILLNSDKKGVICKISDLYYSEAGVKYLDKGNELYVKNETFNIKSHSNYNNDKINSVALCEIKNDTFLPTKYLCYPSFNIGLNATFIKNEEFKILLELLNSYMNEDNSYLLKKTSDYFKNLFKVDLENINFVYYIFNKTILCNLQNFLPSNIKDYEKDEEIQHKLQLYNDEYISNNNSYMFNNMSDYKKIDDKFIIWRHKNKNLIEKNLEKCNTFFFNQSEYIYNYKNLQNVYEGSLYKNINLLKSTYLPEIKRISSIKEYTAFFYNNNNYVVILKNYELHLYFQLKNIVDIVLFQDGYHELSFYYISLDIDKKVMYLYRCNLNSDGVNCEEISFIPYENNMQESAIYLSTVQIKDISAVFISTKTKIWKIYKNKNNVYKRRIIDSIKNVDMEYYGHINCYIVEIVYQKKLFYKYISSKPKNVEKISGCSYLKHFTNIENSLLISFIENKHFIQHTYHIVKDKKFVISSGTTNLTIKVNEISDLIMILIMILCLLLTICAVLKIISFSKAKLGKMKHYIFDDDARTCASSVGK